MRVLSVLAAALLAAGPEVEVGAKDELQEGARALAKEASVLFQRGEFERALQGFTQAYELLASPALLFNIAQCHRNLGRWEREIFFFQRFLEESPETPKRAEIMSLIHEAESALQREASQREISERTKLHEAERARLESESARLTAERDKMLAERAKPVTLRSEGAESDATPLYREWWFWAIVGGAALAVGGVTAALMSPGTTTVLPSGDLGVADLRP